MTLNPELCSSSGGCPWRCRLATPPANRDMGQGWAQRSGTHGGKKKGKGELFLCPHFKATDGRTVLTLFLATWEGGSWVIRVLGAEPRSAGICQCESRGWAGRARRPQEALGMGAFATSAPGLGMSRDLKDPPCFRSKETTMTLTWQARAAGERVWRRRVVRSEKQTAGVRWGLFGQREVGSQNT